MTYAFHKLIGKIRVGKGIEITVAYLTVRKGPHEVYLRARLPCRSNLYFLVNNCYFGGSKSQDNTYRSISEEDLVILKTLFVSRTRYSIWRKAREILERKGSEEAKSFLKEKAQVFRLIAEMKGGEF